MTMPFDQLDPVTITITTPPSAVSQMTVEIPGLQGPPGVFRLGTVTTGAPGTDAAANTTVGTDGVEVINFTIPRGDVGSFGSLSIGAITTLAPGDNASAGISGPAGSQVLTLSIPQGATGSAGPKGDAGIQGPQGVQGIQGPQGPAGTNGQDGAGVQIAGSVSSYAGLPTTLTSADAGKAYLNNGDGLLYVWDGTQFPPQGQGTQFVGPAGPANTLTLGTVTTGAAGTSANATITGTAPNQTLSLTIPTGATGAQGAAGPANTLTIGTVTTGAPGTNAAASIVGTAPSQSLNLTIPQGAQGSAGTNGSNGQGVLFLGASDPVPANTPVNTVIFRPNTKMATFFWGSGTSFPSVGVGYGDTYFHTGLNGLMRYNGTTWRHMGAVVADGTARSNMANSYSGALYAGFQARDPNGNTYEWTGSGWAIIFQALNTTWPGWTVIGAAGAPAFQNGWVSYGAPFGAQFTKINGIVYMQGLVKNGTVAATIFTLPVGYRPATQQLITTQTNPNTIARLDLTPDGALAAASGANNGWVAINYSFPAEQ